MSEFEGTDKTLQVLRELPTELNIDEVSKMIAAFPLLPASASWTKYINLNSILMTTAGTLIIAGSLHFFTSSDVPLAAPEDGLFDDVAMDMEEPALQPEAVVWPGPPDAQKPLETVLITLEPRQVVTEKPKSKSPTPVVSVAEPVRTAAVEPRKEPVAVAKDELTGYTGVTVIGSMDVSIEQGPFSISPDQHECEEDIVTYSVKGRTLELQQNMNKGTRHKDCHYAHVIIHMPSIDHVHLIGSGDVLVGDFTGSTAMRVELSGSGDIHFGNFKGLKSMHVELSGSGDIIGETIEVDDMTRVELAGSGDVVMKGRSKEVWVEVAGSGFVDGRDLKTGSCHVEVVGSGNVMLDCEQVVKKEVTGSGEIHLNGNAGGGKSTREDEDR